MTEARTENVSNSFGGIPLEFILICKMLAGLKYSKNMFKESSSSDESMINQLQELQKKVADMEKGLEEGFKKEQKLAKQLETQVQISEDFQAQMKAKDQQLLDYVNRLQKFE